MRAYHTNCRECGHPLRQRGEKRADFPGTRVVSSHGMCTPCYRSHHRIVGSIRDDEAPKPRRELSLDEQRVMRIVERRCAQGAERDQVINLLGLTGYEDGTTLTIDPGTIFNARSVSRRSA